MKFFNEFNFNEISNFFYEFTFNCNEISKYYAG